MPTHPIQPFETYNGALRFKQNKIVRDLLDHGAAHGFGLNEIARKEYSNEDRQQLAQLIGYSLSGYSELRSYVDDAAYAVAEAKAAGSKKSDVEIERDYLRRELKALRTALRNPMARLFEKHPDDYEGFISRARNGGIFYHGSDLHSVSELEEADDLFRNLSVILGKPVSAASFEYSCSC